jgi:DUF2075 family protein
MNSNTSFRYSVFESPFNKRETKNFLRKNGKISEKEIWPLVYILSSKTKAKVYIGETTDLFTRIPNHLNSSDKKEMDTLHLIISDYFNKSATLDIESKLIGYMAGDGLHKLKNGNLGIMDHQYYEGYKYDHLFKSIWKNLIKKKLAKHSLSYIDNSNLFKYSPFKKLTDDQNFVLIQILKKLSDGKKKTIMIEGGAGTGKTVLATYIIKLLCTNMDDLLDAARRNYDGRIVKYLKETKKYYKNPQKIAIAVAMTSFRETLKKVFSNTNGLSGKMVISPNEVSRNKYDVLIIDEAHRLKRSEGLGNEIGEFYRVNKKLRLGKQVGTQLKWIQKRSNAQIIFYDESQSIRGSDVRENDFAKLKEKAIRSKNYFTLDSQLRVKGGVDYVDYIKKLLSCQLLNRNKKFKSSQKYEFLLFSSVREMQHRLIDQEKKHGLARLIAGVAWEYKSKHNPKSYDIIFKEEGLKFRWNNFKTKNWIHSEKAKQIKEIGCIHTAQGYDLNYIGLIFGDEITYDSLNNQIVIDKDKYKDPKGKQGIKDPLELHKYIINIYKTLLFRGIYGTYVYVCDPELKKYFAKHIQAA